jgi:hypothetical protein
MTYKKHSVVASFSIRIIGEEQDMAEPGNRSADFVAAWLLSMRPHNEFVALKINQHIQTAYQSLSAKGNPTVAEVLEAAQDLAEKNRKGPFDDVGRDAEYYLKSRWQVATRETPFGKKVVALGGAGLNVIYNGLKASAIGLGFEAAMRTDNDVPVSPPGGILWGTRGCDDGLRDDGASLGKPRLVAADIARSPSSH